MAKTILQLLCAAVFTSLAMSGQTRSVERSAYTVRAGSGEYPSLEIYQSGTLMFRMPLVSGLSTADEEEKLSNIQVRDEGPQRWVVTADSSIWNERKFTWKFLDDHIEFQQSAKGTKPLGRCYFFSNGISERWANGTSQGVFANTTVYASNYFSPAPNHADQYRFHIAMPQSVGVLAERSEALNAYEPDLMGGLFAPPPLFLAFQKGDSWASVGIGTTPGNYSFNGLEYSGSKYAGASFWVNYAGYTSAVDGWQSPVAAIHFGYNEFDNLSRYVAWIDHNSFGTQHPFQNASWHYKPIFCGWAEQTREAIDHKTEPHDLATQENYEKWIAVIEKRGLPFGTVVIDDKWQKQYGTFEVDEQKWPDMKGFIQRQHEKRRHVVLWVPAFHKEGVPEELCVKLGGRAIAGDVSNPAYEQFLRAKIRHLVADLGVDGFKEDWVGGVSRSSSLQMHSALFGIEFVRRFQYILYDETHKAKPDALVETQTPNPLFRESSDVLRLNDIWYGARDVPQMMDIRAHISKIDGWPLVDCDNASSTTLEDWWSYMQKQPSIGIPALYFVYKTESTKEDVPDSKWRQLAEIWNTYLKNLNP